MERLTPSRGHGSLSIKNTEVPDKKNLEPATLSHKKVAFVFEPRDSCHQLQLQRDSPVGRRYSRQVEWVFLLMVFLDCLRDLETRGIDSEEAGRRIREACYGLDLYYVRTSREEYRMEGRDPFQADVLNVTSSSPYGDRSHITLPMRIVEMSNISSSLRLYDQKTQLFLMGKRFRTVPVNYRTKSLACGLCLPPPKL